MKSVLILGAAGRIGAELRTGLRGKYELLRSADIVPLGNSYPGEETLTVDIRNEQQLLEAMQGIDCVVHMAGAPDEDTWERIMALNVQGCVNVFEAARKANVKRVVFASSHHAVGYARREQVLDAHTLPRPDSRYGVSKVFGEAIGKLYADKYGLSVASLRIGSYRTDDVPSHPRQLMTFISKRDMVQLVQRCIDAPHYHYVDVYGISGNTQARWDNSHADFLGYVPQDDASRYPHNPGLDSVEDDVEKHFHGGFLTTQEFAGEVNDVP